MAVQPSIGAALSLGYLVNTYPRASHSFIRREILALERQGMTVQRFAMRSDRAGLVDAADLAEDDKTHHVLTAGLAPILTHAANWMIRHPAQTYRAFTLAMQCGKRGAGGVPGTGGRLRHLIYLVEAACLARLATDRGITHIHAHFGTNSTTVAMLTHVLGGPAFSFTAHGPEEFDAPMALCLDLKIARAAFVVAVSSFGRSQLSRWTPPDNWPKLLIVHCGIEPEQFDQPAPLPTSGPRLVAIGRMAGQKGFVLLIEAMAIAVKAIPTLHLTLVGDGELRAEIEAAIARNTLGRHITLTGWLPEPQVRDALARSTALILPSFAEGLPVVVMEAMAAARPIIATAIAGVPELVTPDTGWLVPAGNADALAGAIQTLAQTPLATLTQMGMAARTRVLARHDINTEAAKLRALFTRYANK